MNDRSSIGATLYSLQTWIENNQALAVALAVIVPLLLVALRNRLNAIRRGQEIEEETLRSKQPIRMPQETIDRNRREEARYRKEHQRKPDAPKRGPRPRFK